MLRANTAKISVREFAGKWGLTAADGHYGCMRYAVYADGSDRGERGVCATYGNILGECPHDLLCRMIATGDVLLDYGKPAGK